MSFKWSKCSNLATFDCKIYEIKKCNVGLIVIRAKPTKASKPITRRQILDSSELKDFAVDNFKFDENGRKLSKPVENTVGKGEIALYEQCNEQFLLFPQCFQKACFQGASKGVIPVGMD